MTTQREGRPTGRFGYDVAAGVLDWDDEAFRIHGYEPGSVQPTIQLPSRHDEDEERLKELLARVETVGRPFSIAYRIVDGDGVERRLVLVGDVDREMQGPDPATTMEGYYIDLTEDFSEESELSAKAAVTASEANRATIEQAKGVLMLAYGLNSEQAFAMLRWWSRNRNIKIRDLATRLVELASTGQIIGAKLRDRTDSLLHDLTVQAPDLSVSHRPH